MGLNKKHHILIEPEWKLVSDLIAAIKEQFDIKYGFKLEDKDGAEYLPKQSISIVQEKTVR